MFTFNHFNFNVLDLERSLTFYKDAPLRLKSGLVTPIYVDNRKLTAWPDAWHDVIETMASRIDQLKLDFDVVAGV